MQARFALRMETRLSPNMVMAARLLQMSGADVERCIRRELEANPALELTSESLADCRGAPDAVPVVRPLPRGQRFDRELEQVADCPSPIEVLETSLRLLASARDLRVALYLLYSLDERGYLRASPEELAMEIGASVGAVERGIQLLHELEPPGIGSRDLRECLVLQCRHLEADGVDCQLACRVLINAWEDFASLRWERVARKCDASVVDVDEVKQFIARNLYPYPLLLVPAAPSSTGTLRQPDLIIYREMEGDRPVYRLTIPAAEAWELRISDSFATALAAGDAASGRPSAADKAWVRPHLERARLFMAALNRRWATLRRVGQYLIDHQSESLEHGPRYLRPLTRASMAQDLRLHESTVSRAIDEKLVQLPLGRIRPLSYFFDASLPAKEAIRDVLIKAATPLSDREIADRLQSDGMRLARRTVAKYRNQLKMLPSYHRKRETALSLA
ncbi:MAG: hypothetical protein HYX92_02165 [Chloroflexi bacterium]|nr:hypothetical protein [Chloroflexota bacterium]